MYFASTVHVFTLHLMRNWCLPQTALACTGFGLLLILLLKSHYPLSLVFAYLKEL